ncbi:MAG: hypothetical protein JEY99_15950 [Spirochaetales bacterium]|nr:hypothetical protein [Spirochaetales bacterium]
MSCSRTDSRRNNTRHLPAVLLVFTFLFIPLLCFPESNIYLEEVNPGNYLLDFAMEHKAEILENVQAGMTSSIKYEIRVYRLGQGLFKPLGRNRVFVKDIVNDGSWDPFLEAYVVVQGDSTFVHTDPDEFLKDLFSLRKIPINIDYQPERYYELHIRSNLSSIKLLPPMNIMAPLRRLKPGVIEKTIYEILPVAGGA